MDTDAPDRELDDDDLNLIGGAVAGIPGSGNTPKIQRSNRKRDRLDHDGPGAIPVARGPNQLYFGDNLIVMRELPAESVDLVYLDPPFNSNRIHNVLFKSPNTGDPSTAQIAAFEDTWVWAEQAAREYDDLLRCPNTDVSNVIRSFRAYLGESDVMTYLVMMAGRLYELHRLLRKSGSIYLHCDPTASHYLKIIMDAVFGADRFINEIVWKRTSAHNRLTRYGPVHDIILFYSKGEDWIWNEQFVPYDESYVKVFYRYVEEDTKRRYRLSDVTSERPGGSYLWKGKKPPGHRYWGYSEQRMEQFETAGRLVYSKNGIPSYKRYLDEMPGQVLQDVWTDLGPLHSRSTERLHYPTQKPSDLLKRIITASSNPGDVILDPFCGCGTAIAAAQELDRSWIGIDITHLAIGLVERRLRDAFSGVSYLVEGTPTDHAGAADLARRDKYSFQNWANHLVDATPFRAGKKGADGGIDGIRYFRDLHDGKVVDQKVIVSVKGGENVTLDMIKTLQRTVADNGAEIGLFVTLAPPTKPMVVQATRSGFYTSNTGKRYARTQILTIADVLVGATKPDLPDDASLGSATFKKAPRIQKSGAAQGKLF